MRGLEFCRIFGEVLGDAVAALGITKRNGVGTLRPINTPRLWFQSSAAQRRLSYGKVDGDLDVAGLFANALDQDNTKRHVDGLGNKIIMANVEWGVRGHCAGERIEASWCETHGH